MEILQIHLPEEWKLEDRGIMSSYAQNGKSKKATSMFKNTLQALDESFEGWKVRETPREYPDRFISKHEQETGPSNYYLAHN